MTHENSAKFDAAPADGWTALRYAARRLPAAEQTRFEERLGEDLAACEAVAQAVELAHTVTFLHMDESSAQAAHTPAKLVETAVDAAVSTATTENSVTPAAKASRTRARLLAGAGWLTAAAVATFAFLNHHPQAVVPSQTQTEPSVAATNEDQVTSAWASLDGRRLTGPETTPAEDVAVEHATLRELPRGADEALMLDWLLNGLREESANGPTQN
ncbi:MAG: hypothetical protein QM811_28710 [Pirellulales bacterium]